MRNAKARILATAVVAAGLLVLGALWPFAPAATRADQTAAAPAPDALLSPGGGDIDAAVASLQQRVRANPDDAGALASLGLAYLTKARLSYDPACYQRAGRALRESLRMERDENFQAMVGLGALALARHDFSGALRWGRRAKEVNPYSVQVWGVVTDAFTELGRYAQATHAAQRMVDLRPGLSSFARVSYIRELHGDVPGAIEAMSTALRAAGGSGADGGWASFQLGELYFNSGRPSRALRYYRQANYLDRMSVLGDVGRAKVAAADGDYVRAATILRPVVDRNPSAEYVILLGDLYEAAGRDKAARGQYRLVDAIEELYRSNGVDVDLESALFDADHENSPRAALAAARSEWKRRHSVHVADALAWTLYANGRYHRAFDYAQKALRLGTRSALFNYHAGMIARKLGDESAARRHLTAALDINPHFSFVLAPKARRALAGIGGGS